MGVGMIEGEREAQAIATLTNFATPANIAAILAKVHDMDGLRPHLDNVTPMLAHGLVLKSGVIARALEIYAGYGNDAAGQVGKELGMSTRSVNRYKQWWDGIFKPGIEQRGEQTAFLLEEGIWYSTALAAAPIVEKTPLELIDEATEKKASNPKFTAAQWRRETGVSGDEGSTTSEGGKLWRLLKKLAQWDDSAILDAVDGADARKVLDDARDALVAVRAAVDALEERTKGRVEQ